MYSGLTWGNISQTQFGEWRKGEWKKEAPDGRAVAERKCQGLSFFSKNIRINER